MKQSEYNVLVEKLAEEILNDVITEKTAAEEEADDKKPEETSAVAPELANVIQKMKEEKEKGKEEEDEKEESKEAEELIYAVIEKAAAVYEEGEAIETAAMNALSKSQLYKDAAIKIFSNYGLLND